MGLRHSRSFSVLAVISVLALMVWAEVVLDRLPGGFTFLAFAPAVALAIWLISILPALQRERQARAGAERSAAQAHRLAQSTAAIAHVRTAGEAIEAAVQEALHWLEADKATFFLASDDARQLRVARAVGSGMETGATIDVDLSDMSPIAESIRRLAPVFSPANEDRGARTAVLPLIVDRKPVGLLHLGSFRLKYFRATITNTSTASARAPPGAQPHWWYEAVERARVDAETSGSEPTLS